MGFVLDDTAKVSFDGRGVRILAVALVVLDGPARGKRIAVPSGTARVGSAEGNHLVLADSHRLAGALRDRREERRRHASRSRLAPTVRSWATCGSSRRTCRRAPWCVAVAPHSASRAADEPSFLAISATSSFGELIGASVEMRQVYALLERAAPTDTTLLVQGETGTGKDVLARSVHDASPRKGGAFVPVDCGAIPETLFESELFGHVRGAFTGASQKPRRGVRGRRTAGRSSSTRSARCPSRCR